MIALGALVAIGLSHAATAQMITDAQVARKRKRDKKKLAKLTAADFQRAAKVTDDDLETMATIDTAKGFQSIGGLFDIQRSDIFLRAFVEKAGSVIYQVFERIWYKEVAQRRYRFANFQDGNEVGTAEVRTLDAAVLSCDQYSNVLGCDRSETMVFPIPERLVREIAARPSDQIWRIKFRASEGKDWEEMIAPAEAAGLLAAVDAYRAQRSLAR